MMLVGQTIGPFEIEKELGSGAMGSVYLAQFMKDGKPVRKVAVKVIAAGLGDNERVQQRFEREAEILKQLRHPNIVRLLAVGKYHRSPFYAMEYIDGEPLDSVLERKGRFSWEETLEVGKQICAALQHAHENGIIHRDLKPSNLMREKSGVLKLTDFGIAKDTDVTGLTSANSTVGTAAYMSPEQCRGERNLTNKSDIYSLGVLMYELLTGRKPFVAENAMDMFIQHVQGTFERPAKLFPEIPIWLDTLVCQCLEKKPEQRPADAATVAKALDDVAEKVESRRSAGEEVAVRVAKKSKSKADRDAAEAMSGSRIRRKKKKADDGESGFSKYYLAGFLSLVLIGLIAALALLLQPPGPEKLLAEGNELLAAGDRLFENKPGQDDCWHKWDDAEKKCFNRLIARHPDSKEAAEARTKVEYIQDAKIYLRGHPNANEKNWTKAKEHYDKLLDKLKGGVPLKSLPGERFIAKAREELAPFEAPKLAEDGRKLYAHLMAGRNAYDPVSVGDWAKAKLTLSQLVDRYGGMGDGNVQAGKAMLEKLLVFEAVIRKAQARTASLNVAEKMAMEAVQAELANRDAADAKAKWEALVSYGRNPPAPGARPPSEDAQQRPFILLAEERLYRAYSVGP